MQHGVLARIPWHSFLIFIFYTYSNVNAEGNIFKKKRKKNAAIAQCDCSYPLTLFITSDAYVDIFLYVVLIPG